MATGRRQPPPVPLGSTPRLDVIWTNLLELWKYVLQGSYDGHPAPHSDTHLATGLDPLERPGMPEGLGDEPDPGGGPAYAYEDHVHASGLAAKGDLLGHTATDNVAIPVGEDGQALVADSTVPAGVRWGVPTAADDAEVFAFFFSGVNR